MNKVLKYLIIAGILAPFTLATSVSAKPVPLRPGVYYAAGSRYITIVKKGNQYCYNGFSRNGQSYASLIPVPKFPNRYKFNVGKKDSFNNLFIVQTSKDTIGFGTIEEINRDGYTHRFESDYNEKEVLKDPNIQRCLNSRKPFSLVIPTNR